MSAAQGSRRNQRRTDVVNNADVVEVGKLFDRSPPQSPEAEKGVIGSILLDPRVVDDVALVLKPEHFYSPSYRRLYEVCLALHNASKTVDATLIIERLTTAGEFEMMGGMSMMLDVAECVPTAANAVWYAQIIRDKFQLRGIIHASTENLRDAYDLAGEEDDSVKSVIERAESRIMRISEERSADQVTDAASLMGELLTMIDAGPAKRILTGYHDLDELVQVKPGQVIVIAARPSMGKSAFAGNLMENLSSGLGALRGIFITLEMSRLELAQRMLQSATGIPGRSLSNGGLLTSHDRKKIIEASSQMAQMPIYIDDTPGRTVTDIGAVCRRMKRDVKHGGLDYAIIDYLQIIEAESTKENREVQVATMTKRLKRLARELQIPIFLLSQLNRQTEETKDNRPKMKHLRESGAIEQDADQVWFLHREKYYASDDYAKTMAGDKAEVIVAKQRGGPKGTVYLTFREERCRFENYSNIPD